MTTTMQAHQPIQRSHITLALVLGVTALLGLAPAQAGIPSPLEVHRRIERHVRRETARLLEVPRVLRPEHRPALRSYYAGRHWDAHRRGYYERYHFPVYYRGRVIYQPYDYYDGRLLVAVNVPLPHFGVELTIPIGRIDRDDRWDDDDRDWRDRRHNRCRHHERRHHRRHHDDRWDDDDNEWDDD